MIVVLINDFALELSAHGPATSERRYVGVDVRPGARQWTGGVSVRPPAVLT